MSGGQKQRIAIAGIMALKRNALFWMSLRRCWTRKGRKEVVATVSKLNKEKHMTIVYITHYMVEALVRRPSSGDEQGTYLLLPVLRVRFSAV